MYVAVLRLLFLLPNVLSLEKRSVLTQHGLRPYVLEDAYNWTLSSYDPIPHFDWRDLDAVSPVKDQGNTGCASCWAFSAVANIESQYWRQGHHVILSEQFLLDCNMIPANCTHPAGVVNTFADIITHLGGVLHVDAYAPYSGIQHKCTWHKNPNAPMEHLAGLQRIEPGNEALMVQALRQHGPLSAGINAKRMKDPKRNPFLIDQPTEAECSSTDRDRDHAVLIVGYSVFIDPRGHRVPYWIIKNSWGEGWGDEGYYYLRRGTNACGISMDVTYATI